MALTEPLSSDVLVEAPAPAPAPAPPEHPAAARRRAGSRPPLRRFLAVDLTSLAIAGVLVSANRPLFAVLAALSTVLALRLGDLYRPSGAPAALDQVSRVALGSGSAGLVAAAFTGTSSSGALGWTVVTTAILIAGRGCLYRIERRWLTARPRRVLLVGTGAAAQELAERLLRHPERGLLPVGFVEAQPQPIDPDLPLEVLGNIEELLAVIEAADIDRVIVDTSAVPETDLLGVLDRAARLGVEITVLPVLAQHLSTAVVVEGLAGMTLLTYRPSRHRGISWAVKRALDVIAASAILFATAPVWLATAIAVRLDSPGPVIFRQERVGRGGKPFTLYKFRSMTLGAERLLIDLTDANEADGPYFKVAADPRITRVGRWLRRTSIDELPQLLNVLRGEMSLVGPRPPLANEVDRYPDWFRRRLGVPPGLTGLWQVSGRFLLPFHEAARLDVFYVDHWSFGMDLKILARTPAVVLSGRGAR